MHQNLLCILIHILKTPTQSFSSTPPWLQAGFFFFVGFLFFFLVVRSDQCPSVLLSMMETRTLCIRVLGRQFISDCRIRKKGKQNLGHIPLDEPKLPTWVVNVLHNAFLEIHRHNMYMVGVFFSFFPHFSLLLKAMVTWACELINHTHDTPKNIQKYYIFNLPRVRQFCN